MSGIKFGAISDLHYDTGDKASRADKVDKFVADMEVYEPNFIIQCGDFLDNGWDGDKWDTVSNKLNAFSGNVYNVYGNHEYEQFYDEPSQGDSRSDYLTKTGYTNTYYSFESGDYHVVVLDSNYNYEGNSYPANWYSVYIDQTQLTWVEADLSATLKDTIIFIHHRIDGHEEGNAFLKNGDDLRKIIEDSGKVFVVFMGHDQQDLRTINGIHYIGLYQAWNGTYPTTPYSKVEIQDRRVIVTSVDGGVNYDTSIDTGDNPFISTLTIKTS